MLTRTPFCWKHGGKPGRALVAQVDGSLLRRASRCFWVWKASVRPSEWTETLGSISFANSARSSSRGRAVGAPGQ